MANLTESASWESGIYRIELTDPVVGGEDGIDNVQAKQLGNRTLFPETADGGPPNHRERVRPLHAGGHVRRPAAGLIWPGGHARARANSVDTVSGDPGHNQKPGRHIGRRSYQSATATRNLSVSDGIVFLAAVNMSSTTKSTRQRAQQYGSAAEVSIIYNVPGPGRH
jgi:hypothetical protein